MRRVRALAVVLPALVALAAGGSAAAAPGDLDGSFGTGGVAVADFARHYDAAYALAVYPDGRVLAGGKASGPSGERFALVRLRPDGTLDPFFGAAGRVTTDFPGPEASVAKLLPTPDGSFIAVGTSTVYHPFPFASRIVVARYFASGAPDASFGGGDGYLLAGPRLFGGIECGVEAADAALDSAGRIVVVGTAGCGGEDGYVIAAVARFTADGRLDRTFAGDGARQLSAGCSGHAVAVQPDNRIVVAGTVDYDDYCNTGPMYAARLNINGTFDGSFGRRGRVRVRWPHTEWSTASDVLIDGGGRIVLAGEAARRFLNPLDESAFALARLRPDGRLDPAFGTGGRQRVAVRKRAHEGISAVAFTPTGAIVAAGDSTPNRHDERSAFALARFGPDGAPDPIFGGARVLRHPFGVASGAAAVALAPDGRIVVAGRISHRGTGGDFAVLRFDG